MKAGKLFILALVVAFSVLLMAYFDLNETNKAVSESITFEPIVQSHGSAEIDNKCLCHDRLDPVCGKNGQTYINSCYARCDQMPIVKETIC